MVIPGLIFVFVCVTTGYLMSGGKIGALLHPAEYITILGAATGTLIIASPMKILKICIRELVGSFKGSHLGKATYIELLTVLYLLFSLARKQGLLALEAHVNEPEKSDIFSKYHLVSHDHHAMEFLIDCLRMVIDGSVQPEELDQMLEGTLDTHHAESHIPIGILTKVGDGIPGIGIVGAVLGIIITMGAIDGPPAAVGGYVAAALLGTLLGVFVAYCILNPIISSIEFKHTEHEKYLNVIRIAIVSFVGGATPASAVENARRALFSYDRPTAQEVEASFKNPK